MTARDDSSLADIAESSQQLLYSKIKMAGANDEAPPGELNSSNLMVVGMPTQAELYTIKE